jgi:RES domain-containing protein
MTTLWRISDYSDLKGEGGLRASARWHTRGQLIVYLADSPAICMVERLVHLFDTEGQLPPAYNLLEIEAPESASVISLAPLVDADWKDRTDITRKAGDDWLASSASPLARVPSAIVPRTWNYLLNPLHPDAPQIHIVSEIRERSDTRLFHSGPR